MFEYDPPTKKEPVDYSGLKIGAMLVPVFVLFVLVGKADLGLAVCIVLAMIVFAIKIRWDLRNHAWFWATIVFVLALHIPLVLLIRWPHGNLPTLFYTMPIGIADFLLIQWALGIAEKVFFKGSSTDDEIE